MENLIIRNIQEEDIPSVVDIKITGWQTAYKGMIDDTVLNSFDREKEIEKRKKDYNDNGFIVAESNSEIVGFCRYIDSNKFTPDMDNVDCELMALYVKPSLKYNGIGTKLFEYVTEDLKKKNKTTMILWCLKDNEPSKKFYTKMGGMLVGERTFEKASKPYYEVAFVYNI